MFSSIAKWLCISSLPKTLSKEIAPLYSHPTKRTKDFKYTGYHATQYSAVKDQLKQGRFDKKGVNIFFAKTSFEACEIRGRKPGSVVLLIGSNKNPLKHPDFPEDTYFPKENQDVTILGAWCAQYVWDKHFCKDNRAKIRECL